MEMSHILVVDDDEGVRSFIAEVLEFDSHSVTQAATGEEALRNLQSQHYDLLITDLRMPGQGGMALLRRARRAWPETRALVLTAHGSAQSAAEATQLGAIDFVQKPLASPWALRLLVRRALEHASARTMGKQL